jgi:hypothetical protein
LEDVTVDDSPIAKFLPETELPPEVDTTRAHPARIYDYALGGKSNFAADREVGDKVFASWPGARAAARENRMFLARAVRYLAAEAGVRQFLDIGTGLPSVNSVHEVAQRITPPARVVYVDNDPLVIAHARAMLTSAPEGRTAYVQADLRDPAGILGNETVREVLDLTKPVALMLVAILHFVNDDDDPAGIVAALLDALPPGSYLVASHLTGEHDPAAQASTERTYRGASLPAQWRNSDVFADIAFAGMELIPPGVVLVSEWRRAGEAPRPAPHDVNCYGGVARKR